MSHLQEAKRGLHAKHNNTRDGNAMGFETLKPFINGQFVVESRQIQANLRPLYCETRAYALLHQEK
jgi:hypothetical protein